MRFIIISFLFLIPEFALGDAITVSSKGINSKATGLDGDGTVIGQIEPGRSGKPEYGNPPEHSASNTDPTQVYFQTQVALPHEAVDEHATLVAGVMIGDLGVFEGVAPNADLHSAAIGGSTDQLDVDRDEEFSLTADRLARISTPDPEDPQQSRRMRAINLSITRMLQEIIGENTNGNSHMTKFVDWSAARHDVLYVVAWGNNDSFPKRAPTDNFNGITVAASQQVDPDEGDDGYRKFGTINATFGQAVFPRYSIDLLAPGQPVTMLGFGDNPQTREGTSAAAPHVTGTVALLQQFAKPKVKAADDPKWVDPNARRHEVMKAVMLNSADKLAGVHGSNRDVLDFNDNDWEQSPAFQHPRFHWILGWERVT